MTTTDSNGLVILEGTDLITPLHTTINTVTASVSNYLSSRSTVHRVANTTARNALVASVGVGNITAAKPLLVWRADAPANRQLEFTTDGSNWTFYRSGADTEDTGWVTGAGLVTAATAWNVTDARARNIRGWTYVYVQAVATAVHSWNANGGITGPAVGTLTDSRFRPAANISWALTGTNSRAASGVITNTGVISVTGITGTNSLGIGETVRLGGSYPTD